VAATNGEFRPDINVLSKEDTKGEEGRKKSSSMSQSAGVELDELS
jgi:hypothetical protein